MVTSLINSNNEGVAAAENIPLRVLSTFIYATALFF